MSAFVSNIKIVNFYYLQFQVDLIKDFFSMMVCDVEDHECMLRECEKCPEKAAITEHLK